MSLLILSINMQGMRIVRPRLEVRLAKIFRSPMNSRINWLILILVAWAIAAYLLIPWVSKLYYRHHYTDAPRITQTSDGHPGDPVNIAIEGEDVLKK